MCWDKAVLGHRTVECSAIGPHRQTYALNHQVSRGGAAEHSAAPRQSAWTKGGVHWQQHIHPRNVKKEVCLAAMHTTVQLEEQIQTRSRLPHLVPHAIS